MNAPKTPEARCGQVVGERYELLELVASGGQGNVYRARDKRQGDFVACKVLQSQFAHDTHWRERMLREAKALTILSNTAAVRVYDQKWTRDGALCLIMEWLDGTPLEDRLCLAEEQGVTLTPKDLVPLLEPIVRTLEVAHVNGIVHRDLKPSNVFVLSDGSVRLIDFGFAKFERLRAMTAIGQIAGSPTYLAPECWKVQQAQLTKKIDVYALGVLIFRALAGRPPFEGTMLQLMRDVPHRPRPSLHEIRRDLPIELDDWVQGALAIDPDQRFDSVTALWAAFRSAAGLS